MKHITMFVLSFSMGMNLPVEWFLSLSFLGRLTLIVTLGIIVNIATEWAYPRNKQQQQ